MAFVFHRHCNRQGFAPGACAVIGDAHAGLGVHQQGDQLTAFILNFDGSGHEYFGAVTDCREARRSPQGLNWVGRDSKFSARNPAIAASRVDFNALTRKSSGAVSASAAHFGCQTVAKLGLQQRHDPIRDFVLNGVRHVGMFQRMAGEFFENNGLGFGERRRSVAAGGEGHGAFYAASCRRKWPGRRAIAAGLVPRRISPATSRGGGARAARPRPGC